MDFTNQQTIKEVKLYNLFEKLTDRTTANFLSECLVSQLTPEQVEERQRMFRKLEDPAVYKAYQERYTHLCNMQREYDIYVNKDSSMYRALIFFQMMNEYYYFIEDGQMKREIETVRKFYEVRKFFQCHMFSKYDNQRYSVDMVVTDQEYEDPLQKLYEYLELFEEQRTEPYRIYGSLYDMVSATDSTPYQEIENFYQKYKDGVISNIETVLQEIPHLRFYLDMKRFYQALDERKIPYCMAEFTDEKEIRVKGARDITLLTSNVEHIVCNDFYFTQDKRFWFITGANGGGKTSFLRSVGLCMLLGSQGCYMPASSGCLSRIGKLVTFFPMEEDLEKGRFNAEKERLSVMLSESDGNTMILMNEVFTSTDEEKAMKESQVVLQQILDLGSFGVFVTHNFPLIQSMEDRMPVLEAITEGDEHNRLFKIVEKKQGGQSFATDVLKKYGLDTESLRKKYGEAI